MREVGERFGTFSPASRDAAVDVAAAAAKGGGELAVAADRFVHERAADELREAGLLPELERDRGDGQSIASAYRAAHGWLTAESERCSVARAGELGELLAFGGAGSEVQAGLARPELRWRDVLQAGREDLPRFEFPDGKAVRDAAEGQVLTELVVGSVQDACDDYYERRSEAFAHWHDRARAVVPLDDKRELAAFRTLVEEKRQEVDRSIEVGFLAIQGQAGVALAELGRGEVELGVERRGVEVPPASRGAVEAEKRAEADVGSDGRPARSLARRLAGSGERPDQVVCEYIAECLEAVMTRTVDSFDGWARVAFRRTSLDDPGSRARFWNEFDKRLEASREAFGADLRREKEVVFQEVRETLGQGYSLPDEAVKTVADAERRAGVREGAGAAAPSSAREPLVPLVPDGEGVRGKREARPFGAEADWPVFPLVPDGEGVRGKREARPFGAEADWPVVPPAPVGGEVAVARAREARADLVGTPQALAAGKWAQLDLAVSASKGPRALAAAAERVERSALRQAGLESVGCDPLLVSAARAARDGAGGKRRGVGLQVLEADLLEAHARRCREDPAGADAAERRFASGRAVVRSSASGHLLAEESYGSRCRVEIDARLGRVPGRLPAGEVEGLSETGAKWLESMRATGAVPPAGREVRGDGDARGWVGSLAGRRAQGFDRVVQLAETRRCALVAGPAKALLRWGAAGGTWRAQAVGLVVSSSKHLQAGLLRGNADPLAVAATSSLGSARRMAGGVEEPVGGDRRRLIQLACELSRRQRAAELSPEGHRDARAVRLDQWAGHRGGGGSVAGVLKEAHGDRDQLLSRGWIGVEERRQEERLAGDRDFELLRERVREHGVQVWAQSWQGRGRQGFEEGPEFAFDGRRAYREGVVEEGRVVRGVKALFEISGGSVRHASGGQSYVGVSEGLEVTIPEGLTDEKRQSALLFGAAQTVVLQRNPSMRVGDDEALVLSGVLASHMARELDATYEPPSEVGRVGPRQVSEGLLRRANALVQEVGAQVEDELERRSGTGERASEIGDQVDAVARRAFGVRVEEVVRDEGARGRFEELGRDAGAYER